MQRDAATEILSLLRRSPLFYWDSPATGPILPPTLARGPRHLNPARIHRNRPLNLHLNRSSHRQLHIRTMLQQRPSHSARDSGKATITRAIHAACRQPANAAHCAPNGCTLRRILNSLAGVLVSLNRPFFILHTVVVCPWSVLHRRR